MKVVLISTTPPPVGGISRWTERMLASELPNNWEIVLVDDKPIKRESFGDDTRRNFLNEIRRAFRVWRDLSVAIKDNDVKIVHSCPIATLPSLFAAYVESLIVRRKKKGFISHFRCTIPNLISGRLSVFFLRKLCKNTDCIIALNSQTKQYLSSYTDTPIEIVPNFADISHQTERVINDKLCSVVYVGGVTEEKGCLDIVEVAKRNPEIVFKLIGKAEKRIVEESEKVPNVQLLGVLGTEKVIEELNSSDVFMFLSVYPGEGFSNALVEAMASGLPCIVSDWAANADMIENKGGIVVPVHDPASAIQALNDMTSKHVRLKMAKWNVQKVYSQYASDVVIKKYVEIYEKYSARFERRSYISEGA